MRSDGGSVGPYVRGIELLPQHCSTMTLKSCDRRSRAPRSLRQFRLPIDSMTVTRCLCAVPTPGMGCYWILAPLTSDHAEEIRDRKSVV